MEPSRKDLFNVLCSASDQRSRPTRGGGPCWTPTRDTGLVSGFDCFVAASGRTLASWASRPLEKAATLGRMCYSRRTTLRKYRCIGHSAVGEMFARTTETRWSFGPRAGNEVGGGPPRSVAGRCLSEILFPRGASSTVNGVSLQGHEEQVSHDSGSCVVSPCRCPVPARA